MHAKATLSSFTFSPPVPELPVRDVARAQAHYRDKPFEPAVHWVYAPDIEAIHAALHDSGANITGPLEKKPWGLTQFTVEDLDGNRFYFHRD